MLAVEQLLHSFLFFVAVFVFVQFIIRCSLFIMRCIGNAGSICSIFSVLPNTVVDKYCIDEEHNLN